MKAPIAIITATCLTLCPPASAQPERTRLPRSAEATQAMNIAERNQLGLLEYCNRAGHIGPEAVTRQRGIVETLPPGPPQSPATQDGQKGLIAFEESRISLAQDAAAQGISVAYSCFQLALRVTGAP